MKLYITSPDQKKDFEVAWVEINTQVGNFVIQPGHAPMIVSLQPDVQVRFCLSSGKQGSIATSSGLAHVTRSSVMLLLSK